VGTKGSFQIGLVERQAMSSQQDKEDFKRKILTKPERLLSQRLAPMVANPDFEVCADYIMKATFATEKLSPTCKPQMISNRDVKLCKRLEPVLRIQNRSVTKL